MNGWGHNVRLSIFGESHGAAIGVTLDGLPHGFALDLDAVRSMMARRSARGELSTPRNEADEFEILSGFFNGYTTGSPLCAIIRNTDTRSRDYKPNLLRPSHADFTALKKFGGFADYRGGGHFSGRLTAPLVFAGAVAAQMLAARGVTVGARILSVSDVRDGDAPPEAVVSASAKPFPVTDDAAGERMKAAILAAKADGDSVGGVVECVALGVPVGLGEPFFNSVESSVSSMLFSIPAVKGVEFGEGFALAALRGSQANDQMEMQSGAVQFLSNRSGGINGGITNGCPLVVRAAFRPTPTISKVQMTADIETGATVSHTFTGRHDPCVVPRAVVVVEAAIALCLLDFMI